MTYDSEHRRRAIEETGRSFIVEASAGTGKTSVLINRIVHLVLEKGPCGVPLPLSSVCAITFTEKAAGEMKVRLRQRFEEAARSSGISADRAREALYDLETAAISTFHAFAVSLLKERPIEAGIDPQFTSLDEIQAELFFREVWSLWLDRALVERRPPLECALRAGIRLGTIEDLARTLRFNERAVRALSCGSPPTEDEVRRRIQLLQERGRDFHGLARKPNDRLIPYLDQALNWLKNPVAECPVPSKPGLAGAAANWTGGKETVRTVQEFVREIAEFCSWYGSLPSQRLLTDLVEWIVSDFLREWESCKRKRGLLDFDDQIWMARDLLSNNRAARREFQKRYSALVVDEFQDTDPVQWDIVLLLSSPNLQETDRSRLKPGPGRLFAVGDPKQSIYRFRHADIESYLSIVDSKSINALGMETLQLSTNFRSVPSILRFVDGAFKEAMRLPEDGCYQPDYLAFGGHGERTVEPYPTAVSVIGFSDKADDSARTVREFLGCEAARIARLINQMRGSEDWKILDPAEPGGKRWRAPQYGDIAVLLPVLTRADIFEEALRGAEIPYVLEGGKFYYARSEVSSAITVLRAIANPNDPIALYGSLRSIFFGLSDEDLLKARIDGQSLDYRAEVPAESPLSDPFEVLRDLHRNRHYRRASETFEILLQKTGAREVLSARGYQSYANLMKLARTLRSLQGESTFPQVIDLLCAIDEEGVAESESRIMEERSDAVRVMSVHKAKGLDFSIVFAAGFGLKKLSRNRHFLADPHRRKIFAVNIGTKGSGLQTPGWNELAEAERKREDAELARLLYVGLTRARDYLILCAHTRSWRRLGETDQWLPEMEGTRLAPISPFLMQCVEERTGLVRWVDGEALDSAATARRTGLWPSTRDMSAILDRDYRELEALIRNTPSGRELQVPARARAETENEDRLAEEEVLQPARDKAVRLGIAFHEAMEQVDMYRLEAIEGCAELVGTRYKLDEESVRRMGEMMRVSLSSALLERARHAACLKRRVLREIPFVRPLKDAIIEEGKIDLLFEEAEGWVLVDYKTDRIPEKLEGVDDFFGEKYGGQIREYVQALEALRLRVKAAYLLLARTGLCIAIKAG